MAQPATSLDVVERFLVTKYTGSIVSVKLRPKKASEVSKLWNNVYPPGKNSKVCREREKLSGLSLRGTGFFMREDEMHLYVLTSAHLLTNLFSASMQISTETIKYLYDVFILCDHADEVFKKRRKTPAAVLRVCCSTDLMLLRIKKDELMKNCSKSHPVVSIADAFPAPLDRVFMLSWPHRQERTVVSGRISHPGRKFSVLSPKDVHGYMMTLSEVDMTSDFGSSGAPLLDTAGCCVGLLQSGDTVFSYFVSLDDVRNKLTEWGFI